MLKLVYKHINCQQFFRWCNPRISITWRGESSHQTPPRDPPTRFLDQTLAPSSSHSWIRHCSRNKKLHGVGECEGIVAAKSTT